MILKARCGGSESLAVEILVLPVDVGSEGGRSRAFCRSREPFVRSSSLPSSHDTIVGCCTRCEPVRLGTVILLC